MAASSLLQSLLMRTLLLLFLLAGGAAADWTSSLIPQAAAQDAGGDVTLDSINTEMRQKLDSIREELDRFGQAIQQDMRDDARLAELRVSAEEIIGEMRAASDALGTRVQQIQGRLDVLGEPPQNGQPPEPALVSEERNRLLNERAEINAIVEDAQTLSGAADRVANHITTIRRDLFAQTLFRHTELSLNLFAEAGDAVIVEVQRLGNAIGSWLSFALRFKAPSLFGAIALSLVAGLVILSAGYRVFGRFIRRNNDEGRPSYLKRLTVAFWSTVVSTMSLAAFLFASHLFLDGFSVLRPDVAPIMASLFGFIWFVYFVSRLTHAVLAPDEPDWRLVRLTDRGARLIGWAVILMAVVNGLDYFLGTISETLNSPLVLTITKSVIASTIIGLILLALSFMRPVMPTDGDPTEPGKPWPRFLPLLLRLMGGLLIFAVIAGYVGFARFVATQIVLTGAVLVTIYVGLLTGKAVSRQGVFGRTVLGQRLGERRGWGEVTLDQIGLVAGLAIYAFALMIGVPLILLTWGFQIADIESWFYRFFTEITIGNITISLVGIVGGILLFAAGYVVTRWVQKWVDGNVMARSQVDAGVRNSVKTGIGYLGIGLAVIVGVSAAGIDLSSLALVASALSVGIGFGLQNIVSNFVSGLILLVERPFKVGDHVVTGTTEGIVKRISVRATEIETFRKQSIVVPNSDLINAPVGNWTHRNKVQRSEIPVSVAYGTDPEKVIAILLEIANARPEALRNPEPHVDFLAFGASSLDFELRFCLADYSDGIRIRAEVRIEILKRFEHEGIEIPYARQDIMILPRPGREEKKQAPEPADVVEEGGDV
ncbi:small-conductance mechanosensitive channel [Pseudorhizobium tarimense]|uniref:Small-conductance mechanosensitive channel n=1 Tax=Pseudorhizobium tarimense TaxID=1079109 RepID=A0ABV2H391_9HYPH|nr:mechanosensitive ion channel family protein [Pseudorhizobium tarimense]MCJ8518014.1 mechanosensitive ion channel family protein [Pseudorhizobium tarimense]